MAARLRTGEGKTEGEGAGEKESKSRIKIRGGKGEGRVLFIDVVGGAGGALLAIVFRGGWIDCMAARADPGGWAEAAEWLESQGFMLEVTAASIGAGPESAWGRAEADGLSGWAAARGFESRGLGRRNASQAATISRGIEEYLGAESPEGRGGGDR
jgi:hypothetical protein